MKNTTRGPTNGRSKGASLIYETLREEILRLDLKPGAALDEIGIAGKFGLSRSPVREALVKLASEGLVTSLPNKTTIVKPLMLEDYASYIETLDLIQRSTTRLAALSRQQSDLKNIMAKEKAFLKAVAHGNPLLMIETNRNFHVAISDASHNKYLSEFNARLLDEGRRYLRLYFHSLGDTLPSDLSKEHQQIIDAITNQDADEAEHLAHQHTMQVKQRFLSYLSRERTSMISTTPKPTMKTKQ